MEVTAALLQKMLAAMDKNGDGKTSKEEFKLAYVSLAASEGKTVSDAEYDKLWVQVDKDKSGDVSIAELASYFGFEVDASGMVVQSTEMDDDTILEALKMAYHLHVVDQPAPEASPKPEKVVVERYKAVTLKSEPQDSLERRLLEDAWCGDVASVNSLIDKMVAQKKTILIEDSETGLSPLLRIARFGDSAEVLARKMLDVGGEPRRDVNYQGLLDKKTPLHVAAEHGQANFMKLILDRGADPMIREAEGRSALHSAVHSNKIAAVIALLEHPKVVMKKLDLIQICDNHGRTALHIAAFRDSGEEPEIVKLLLEHGADPKRTDKSNHTAGKLAGKSGRRKSRELLDAYA
ncbi:hypothetical protein AB1Y20_007159 [Prymnesium parvum]